MWLEKTAFLGEEGPFILLLYTWENYLGQNMVPVQKNIFFTGHKFCFSILFPSKGTICGAPASLSCWFSAGVCTASCLVSLGSVLWLIVPSMALSRFTWSCTCASSPAAPQPCMGLSCQELLFTLHNPPCYYHYYHYCYHPLPVRESTEFY